ncbi:uncharacterized protein B0I36DRAFT_422908 [Microdochium trichocladiopsis]|uniref:Carrier domain-containing protein n=1 Tax=Microdochium trichocladiopsis TaxID=1682393 RepID=A0A9P8Y693_9PEZI|nr:uncharacterized protein B0I36DRAFT_422908 [Microdochium trichocladiopsis]KAH7029173.1 hypothetical protein B0I36DRAFT_422908 [Microdochium trichocladiopsis]
MAHDLNYFTCTLGQAAQYKQTVPENEQAFDTVLDLVDQQAEALVDRPALGFADYTQENEKPLSFSQLRDLSIQATEVLLDCLKTREPATSSETIGLICASGLDFVLTWLGLMRLGYTVFLLALVLGHYHSLRLCSDADSSIIFIDDYHYDSFKEAQDDTLSLLKVPSFSQQAKPDYQIISNGLKKQADTAYLRHTSGTSSGLPKPIVQSQLGAVGVLARLPMTENPIATFSTTPLYHGGLADCFRSWSCGASIWFFPEGKAPITCANILKAVRFARDNSSSSGGDDVRYFSSVPYVLQMLSEEEDGIRMLKTMDLVGVGGAALPTVIGDRLVDHDVRLVSRMGSTECGFLLSSDRDYDEDKEWQYLRCAVDDPEILAFEPQAGSDLCELVAGPKWPLRNKTNREDGSFATSDLFERHKSIPNAWKYHSRSDAQITLANGKKFDPAPLEDAMRASLGKVLQDVLVFGAGREYPGAILFGRSASDTEEAILNKAWPAIEELNKSSSSQARLSRAALVGVVPQDTGDEAKKPLEKSSKGTLLRKQAEERYGKLIESVYSSPNSSCTRRDDVTDEEIPNALLEECSSLLGRNLDMDEDLFQQGVDSIACIQLRRMIASTFLSKKQSLPFNIIYDCGSIKALAAHIAKIRKGQAGVKDEEDNRQEELDEMRELVRKYSNASPKIGEGGSVPDTVRNDQKGESQPDTIVLTGATGLLGAHILDVLATKSSVRRIYCLARGRDKHAARERVRKALALRGLNSWDPEEEIIVCLPADLTKPDLGLEEDDWSRIRRETSIVIHAAWTVNFSLRLRSFDSQIAGVRNLLDLAACTSGPSPARFYFVSSTAAVGAMRGTGVICEEQSSDPADATRIGYAQSKWVAEQVCAGSTIARPGSAKTPSHNTIIRIGQLCGSSSSGVWNASEAYPLMLSTANITGALPRLPEQGLNWLPVDQAAAAVTDGCPVYHVLQPHMRPTWAEMLEWLSKAETGPRFSVVPSEEWLLKLQEALGTAGETEDSGGQSQKQHPSASLLSFWQDRYRPTTSGENDKKVSVDETAAGSYLNNDSSEDTTKRGGDQDIGQGELPEMSRFSVRKAQQVSKTMAAVKSLTKSQVLAMWRWICEHVGTRD